jgi:formylmethanofuran dehydrogenase subunit E
VIVENLDALLEESARLHSHLCPRQVLGVRMGLAGGAALGMHLPRRDKELLIIIETDGCFADGVVAATGCTVGHRTLRVEDYGKVAVTFVNVESGRAVRLAPRPDVRQRAHLYAPEQPRRYDAQLHGYQRMPDDELFVLQAVSLRTPVKHLVSRPGLRVNCQHCDEEIINQRELHREGKVLCAACAGQAYYNTFEGETLVSNLYLQLEHAAP